MENEIKHVADGLETYRGNLDNIKGTKFLVSFAASSVFEKEALDRGISFKKEMLGEVAAYIVTLENK